MTHKVVFDHTEYPEGKLINLACGHISQNQIVFVNQSLAVDLEARTGEIAFCDLDGKVLLSARVELPGAGDEKFSEGKCCVAGEQIKLGFPRYSYEDNYPHCDGEHDRWTKIISGYRFLCYDLQKNCIVEDC